MKRYTLSILAVGLLMLLGLGTVSALGMGAAFSEEDKEFAKANKEAIREAVESGDYASWEGLMQERLAMMEDNINEETFNSIVAHHANMQEFKAAAEELRESGELDKASFEDLREEYGIEGKGKRERSFKKGFKMGMKHQERSLAE